MLISINTTQNSWRAWLLAMRPKTLAGAAVPVMLGVAYAWRHAGSGVSWTAAALCLAFALIMQVAANFINDFLDCAAGRDNDQRLGPPRACQQGWVTMRAMRNAIVLVLYLAALCGLPLVYYGGWKMVAVGAACLVFCPLYTTHLAARAMGDLLVVIFFGIVPVVCTCYVCVPPQWQTAATMPWALGVACGLAVDTLLVVNNYRDIDCDREAGKRTLVVLIGRKAAEWLYLLLIPVALVIVLIQFGWTNTNILIAFVVYFFHINAWNDLRRIAYGPRLNTVLAKTARNILLFGVLTTALVIFA